MSEGFGSEPPQAEDSRVHWSMRPGANDLTVRVREYGDCLCGKGRSHIEAAWPIHGWTFSSGQCCDCLNIGEYSNGAEPDDFKSDDRARVEYADENFDQIHICDLGAFIEALQAIQAAKIAGLAGGESATTSSTEEG